MKSIHLSVCICTFKRPELLRRCLNALRNQKTGDKFNYSIVVSDNDDKQSARAVVSEYGLNSSIAVKYCVEPEQNIALARNRALANADGDFVAFIDDDEVPENEWLYNLFITCKEYGVDGVLGPVLPYFEHNPPAWIIKGNFFARPTHKTGYRMGISESRSGNLLFKRGIVIGLQEPFRPQYGTGGEDVDFFIRMMKKGRKFIWCQEAVVNEFVSPSRSKGSYLLKLALLRGGNLFKHHDSRKKNILKSFIAVPAYSLFLPFAFIAGKHHLMKYLIKLCDHIGRLLAMLGIQIMKRRDTL